MKKTKKNQSKRMAGTLQMLASEKLLDLGITPFDLIRKNYPDTVVLEITKLKKAKRTLKNTPRVQRITKFDELKKYFIDYNEINSDGDYDIYDKELAKNFKLASKILNKNDIKDKFWQNVLGNILIALHETEYIGGPKAKYRNEIEKYFKILLKKLYDFNDDDMEDYQENDFLFDTLVDPIINYSSND